MIAMPSLIDAKLELRSEQRIMHAAVGFLSRALAQASFSGAIALLCLSSAVLQNPAQLKQRQALSHADLSAWYSKPKLLPQR